MDDFRCWDYKKREALETMAENGLSQKEMSRNTGISEHLIRKELLRGLEGIDRDERRYNKYLVEIAVKTIIIDTVGVQALERYLKYCEYEEDQGKTYARLKMKELHNDDRK